MKRILVASILGITATVATQTSVLADARIFMDTFASAPYPTISYAASGEPATDFTAEVWWALGDIRALILPDPTGRAIPSSLGPLTKGTGPGSTATIFEYEGDGGWFSSESTFVVPGALDQPGTFMIVAYNGTDYVSSTVRGHSDPFLLILSVGPSGPAVGSVMNSFTVGVPEPSTFAIVAFGATAFLAARRRK